MLAAPTVSQAATLTSDRPCYGPAQRVSLSGTGFTPSGRVALTAGGRQLGIGDADPAGLFRADLVAPTISGPERVDSFVATDQTDLAITATTPIRLTALRVDVKPKRADPGRVRRIAARGFTTGNTLYAHVRRGTRKRNVRIGRLKGACGTLSVRKRILSSGAPPGVYRVQFDSRRRYSARTAPQVTFLVTVFRRARGSHASAASSGGERWALSP
jgi:hypothetical protein